MKGKGNHRPNLLEGCIYQFQQRRLHGEHLASMNDRSDSEMYPEDRSWLN